MKTTPTHLLLTAALLGSATLAQAQRKLQQPLQGRLELQLEQARKNGDFLWGSLHMRRYLEGAGSQTQYNWLQGGYEHFWSENWSGGGNLRLAFYKEPSAFDAPRLRVDARPELLLRHRGQALGLTFGQRLSADYEFRKEPQRNLGQLRLRLDVERVIPVGERVQLRPRLAYEAAANIRLQPPENAADQRTIEQATWRGEIGLRLSEHFDLTPYVARQADFVIYLPQYDADGNLVGGGRTNVRTPVVGLDLRYTIFQGDTPFKRVQLPTQH